MVSVIIEDFDRESLEKLYEERRDRTIWSLAEIELLTGVSPLTVMDINRATDSDFPIKREYLNEQSRALAEFLVSTIDNSVFKGVLRPEMIKSKVRNLSKLYTALGEEPPIKEDNVNQDTSIDIAYQVKVLALSALKRYFRICKNAHKLNQNTGLPFVDFFTKLFGDKLDRIIQYGSSVNGGGSDIDLAVLVNRFDRSLYDLILGQRSEVPSEKPVSIVLFPSHCGSLYLADTSIDPLQSRLVYGSGLDVPILPEEEKVRRAYCKSGKELTSLRDTLSDTDRQEAMRRRPEFLRDTLKLEIWIRKALLQKEIGRYLQKDEFLVVEGVEVVDLGSSPSIRDVREALYDANHRVKERIKRHIYQR